jgi:hypothetical protein
MAAVTKEIFTDSSSWYPLTPNTGDRWGRKAGMYQVSLLVEGETYKFDVSKPGEDVVIEVLGK